MMELLPPAAPETAALRREMHDTAVAVGLDKLGASNVVWWDAVAADADGRPGRVPTADRRLGSRATGVRTAAPDEYGESVRIAIEEGRLADAAGGADRSRSCPAPGATQRPRDRHARQAARLAGLDRDTDTARTVWVAICADTLLPDGWGVPTLVADAVASALAAGLAPDEVRACSTAGCSPAIRRRPGPHDERGLRCWWPNTASTRRSSRCVERSRQRCATSPVPVQGLMEIALAQALLATGDRAGARRAGGSRGHLARPVAGVAPRSGRGAGDPTRELGAAHQR